MAAIGLAEIERQHELQVERVGRELARSVANAVDAELRSSVVLLEALASLPTLDTNDLAGFLERARRVLALRAEWVAITLTDADGILLLDTRHHPGDPLLLMPERESFDTVLRTGASVVGSLRREPGEEWLFPVRTPVIRAGGVRYVLTALVRPSAIRDLLVRQQFPADWLISIVDAHGRRVARSRAHEENLGGALSDSARDLVARGGAEGFGVTTSLEGDLIFTPYSQLSSSGWVAVLGMPAALVDAAAFRSVGVYGGGVLLSLGVAAFCAIWAARSITGPIAELRAAAEALGRREPLRPVDTSIREIRAVGAALTTAAEERDRGEARIEELLRKERLSREEAEAADRAKEQFMAVLSHELRTPLNAVYGWARMLQSGQIRDEALAARARDAIVRNADIQVQLIDDLLDFSRITSGKMRLELRPVDLADVVRGAVDAVRPAADAKGVRLAMTLDATSGQVAGDPARLQQIVWNLLMNAVKFTPAGGHAGVEVQRDPAGHHIVVRDSGLGIAPEVLPHVFERFRQADSSSTRMHGGLGLALVKHLVELHGGHVVAQSDGPGSGATFIVSLPMAASEPRAEPIVRPLPVVPVSAGPSQVVRLHGLRVLVADNDPEALALAEAILNGAGAEVATCLSAAEAFDRLKVWRPDVLVSDIEMPGEDGYALIRKVRALPPHEGGGTPAIALTAYGRPQDRVRSLAAGFNMHVPKPVDPGELTAIIADVGGRSMESRG